MQIDKYHEIAKSVEECAEYLYQPSHAFDLTGNEVVSRKLRSVSSCLYRQERDLKDAVSHDVTTQFNQIRETSSNILNATIAGVKIAETETSDEAE